MPSHTILRALAPVFFLLSGCSALPWVGGNDAVNGASQYFSSPEDAVKQVSRLLESRDWGQLSQYYDLENSTGTRAALLDGSYFVRAIAPSGEETGAARQWRPFYPGSKFSHVNPTQQEDVIEVVVEYETEAEGGLRLRGYDSFRMRRSARGWRLLAD